MPIPARGAGTFAYAPGTGRVAGVAGTLRRYQVAVEAGAGLDAPAFAAAVDTTLADPRGWIAGRDVRFQRIPPGSSPDFVVYLATEATSERMCAMGGLSTRGYTSCRLPGKVVINLTRWLRGIPDYGAPLSVYRQYTVNHEVGHELGHGHEACGGRGRPAPVMQQQTYGLKGCLANPWPYLDGVRYAGDSVA